jgi:hypothetical protein
MSNLKHEGAIKDGGMHAPNSFRQHTSTTGVHVGEEELLEAPPGLGLRPAEALEPRQPRSAGLEPFRPQLQPEPQQELVHRSQPPAQRRRPRDEVWMRGRRRGPGRGRG